MEERLGRYRIKREIGRGGMGTVYEAVDEERGRVVALKVLPPELAREAQFFHRFRREIRTLAALDHGGIVKILDVGSEGARHYYAMEYVDGPSLQAILERERRLDPIRACEVGLQLCEALEHAHRRGVVHRDIKPANILVDSRGEAHLTDFGIAKVIQATRMTTTGGIVGTAEYMSPEQAEGRAVDRRSDLYSLGVVLYRALTGRVPFEGETVLDVIRQHRFAVLESPKELNPEIPSTLSALIEQLLEKDPEKRPPSAGLAGRALQAAHRMLEAGGGELAEILFQRAEERPFHHPRSEVFPQEPLLLPFGHHRADEIQVLDEGLIHVLLHEFRALPHLDPHDFSEMRVIGYNRKVSDGKTSDLLQSVFLLGQCGAHVPDNLPEFFLEEGDENIVLVLKIQVNRPVGYARLFGDLGNTGIIKTFFGKNFNGCLKDLLVFVFVFHIQVFIPEPFGESSLVAQPWQFFSGHSWEIFNILMNDYSFNGYLTQPLKGCQVFFSISRKKGLPSVKEF